MAVYGFDNNKIKYQVLRKDTDDSTTGTLKAAHLTSTGSASIDGYNLAKGSLDNGEQGLSLNGPFQATKVLNAVYNDLADAIEVPADTQLKAGYCYNLSGSSCKLTQEYAERGILGIHSDTYGFEMGIKKQKCIDLAVAGFVLAYVDKEYPSGTPLTCTSGGRLTEMKLQDKKDFPERLVGIFWKKEINKEWGPEDNKIKVDGRCWVKII